MKAIWRDQVIAESDATVMVENNHYFPADSIRHELLGPSDKKTHCPWKGDASYNHIRVGDEINKDAVWCYAEPKQAAQEIKGRYAFWRGVEVRE
ncbi:MAG: DUF427 domain-containing protein [Pseudomonadales bacterium]